MTDRTGTTDRADPTDRTDTENPYAGQGMVVLDIGGEVGALLIAAGTDLVGAEIEICPSGARAGEPDEGAGWWDGDWHSHGHTHEHSHEHGHTHTHEHGPAWPHVAVLARPTAHGPEPSAVFPGLRAGCYDLWLRPDGDIRLTAEVVGGEVTTAAWPDRT